MELITNIPLILFSSQLPTLEFSDAGEEAVEVLVYCSQYEVLHTTVYPIGGRLFLYDLQDLFEECMREHDMVYGVMSIEIGNSTWEDYVILYCPQIASKNAGDFISSHFLTTLRTKRVPGGTDSAASEMLSFLRTSAEDGQSVTASLVGTFRTTDSSVITLACQFALRSEYGVSTFGASPAGVLSDFSNHYDGDISYGWEDLTVLSYTYSLGNRSLTFFVDAEFHPQLCFAFRNVFNVVEYAYLEGTTVTKSDTERSLATSHGVSMFYDQEDEQVFEVTTAPLSSEEADWIVQMLLSHKVQKVCEGGVMADILITDIDAAITDSDTEYRRIKFSYRMARQGAVLPEYETPSGGRRFTAHYSSQYT